MHYNKAICRVETHCLLINFLESCKRADIIPRFLKFRMPNNDCFDDRTVNDFQLQLLRKELQSRAKLDETVENLEKKGN